MPVYLSIENPYVAKVEVYTEGVFADEIKKAKAAGHDGVLFDQVIDGGDGLQRPDEVPVDVWVAFKPTQIKSAFNGGRFDPGDPAILASIDSGPAQGPVFFSGLNSAIENSQQPSAPGPQWQGTIRKLTGIKKEEIEWSGVMEWLDARKGNVKREDLLQFLRENEVQIKEVKKSDPPEIAVHFGDYQVEDPDPEFIKDQAKDIYLEDATTNIAQSQGVEESEVDSEEALERATEMATDAYYSDVDVRQTRSISVDVTGHDRFDFTAYYDYNGMIDVVDDKDMEVAHGDSTTDDAQLQRMILGHLEEKLGIGDETASQYGSYTLEGGENYTELLLTMPTPVRSGPIEVSLEEAPGPLGGPQFRGSHFSEPNILAHVRFKERVDAEGNKVLFIEEIQSDWHQAGREGGYRTPEWRAAKDEFEALAKEKDEIVYERHPSLNVSQMPEDVRARLREMEERTGELVTKFKGLSGRMTTVPDAPFKTSWHELAMKRMLRYAVDNDFDRIAWTPGSVQNKRYSLSSAVDEVGVKKHRGTTKRTVEIVIANNGGVERFDVTADGIIEAGTTVTFNGLHGRPLSEAVGKEMAKKIMAVNRAEVFDGENLEVGGEGMRGFYDKMLPRFMNKYGKKWGAKVGKTKVETGLAGKYKVTNTTGYTFVTNANGADQAKLGDPNAKIVELSDYFDAWSFDITPEMKISLAQGQSLFSQQLQISPSLQPAFRAKLEAEVMEIGRRILGRNIRIGVVDRMDEFAETEEDNKTLRGLAGIYMPAHRTIWVALATRDPATQTMRHETIHALRDMGMFTKPEWATLKRAAMGHWFDQYRIKERYEETYRRNLDLTEQQLLDVMAEEAVAEAFSEYVANPEAHSGVVARIFERVWRFLEAVRNMLAGRGFHTIEDIFETVESGEVGKRTENPDQGRGYTVNRRRGLASLEDTTSFTPPVDTAAQAWANHTRPLTQRAARTVDAATVKMRRHWQDKFIDVKRYQKAIEESTGSLPEHLDAYLAESLYYGRAGQRLDDFRQDHVEPLFQQISDLGLTLEDVDTFLYARHAPERNSRIASINTAMPDGGSGMTTSEADRIMQDFNRRGVLGTLNEIGDRVDEITRDTRDALLRAGLIDQETHQNWSDQYQHYVPLRGFETDPDEDGSRWLKSGQRFDIRGPEAHQAFGRSSISDSPIAYVFGQAQQAIVRAEKNKVGKTFLRLVQENPNEAVWEINKVTTKPRINQTTGLVEHVFDLNHKLADNVFSVKVGGQAHYITLHHKGLAEAMKGLGTESMNGAIRALAAINRYLSFVNTALNPEFVISNFTRDLQTAAVHLSEEQIAGLRGRVVKDVFKAIKGAYDGIKGRTDTEWSQSFREYADAGGRIAFFGLEDIETIKKKINREFARINPSKPQSVLNAVRTVEELVRDINGAVENGVRLSAYHHARQAGMTKAKAASLARELTVNFNRKGQYGAAMNAMYLFYNASLQGGVRLLQAVSRSKTVRKIVASVVMASFTLDMINRLLLSGVDDDDKNLYDKIPFYEKERNLLIMWPAWLSETKNTEGAEFKIPLPYGYNVFHVLGQQIGAVVAGATSPLEAAANITKTAINSFNPIGGDASLLKQLSPTATDPVVDIATNKDWLGRNIKPVDYPGQVPRPESQKYWSTVSPQAKWVAQNLNKVTGGNEARPGMIDVSPEVLEYMLNFMTGGAGMFATRSTDFAIKLWNEEDWEPSKTPFVRRVYRKKSRYWDRQLYYEIQDRVLLAEKEVKILRSLRKFDEAKQARKGHQLEWRMLGTIKSTKNRLRQLRKQYRKWRDGQDFDPKLRREKMEHFQKKQDQVMSRARKKYYALENKQASD